MGIVEFLVYSFFVISSVFIQGLNVSEQHDLEKFIKGFLKTPDLGRMLCTAVQTSK